MVVGGAERHDLVTPGESCRLGAVDPTTAVRLPRHPMRDPEHYFNRELSWLAFNAACSPRRVNRPVPFSTG